MASSRRPLLFLLLVLALLLTGCSGIDNPVAPDLHGNSGQQGKSAPPGYYDTVDTSTPGALRTTLHAVIDDHTKIPYTASSTDTWNVLEIADQDPNDSGRILDVYLNASFTKYGAGNTEYNREHTWPKSYGFPNDGSSNYPYSDCHQLFLCSDSYNSSRSNKPFRNCSSGCSEKTTQFNDGVGGGSGVYPGNSNWTSGSFTAGSWETWIGRRGDVARALFYLDVRYEGGTHGVTGYSEPDMILTDNESQIAASNTGSNESVAYMGMLSVLIQWHLEDPVDAKEMARNDAVYTYQGNRNPFIDNPEWVSCLFGGSCGGSDTTPPATPTGLIAVPGDGRIDLDWNDSPEPDLAGYRLYRATVSGGPYSAVGGLITASQYPDTGLSNDTTYYYILTAEDNSLNESTATGEVSATPVGSGIEPVAWINEFHYDNSGTDTGEFFEIAGTAGTNLSNWTLVGYNGNGGAVYNTIGLSGSLPDQQNGFGTLYFNMLGMQNGSPDGLALVDELGVVVMFISYEGAFTANGGAADGMTSTNIGVSENSSTPAGYSLQLGGTGSAYADFSWQTQMADTRGAVNSGQTFIGSPVNQDPIADAGGPYFGEKGVAVNFDSSASSDPDGTIVAWDWIFGDGNTSTEANPAHIYTSIGSFTAVLTVTDNLGATGSDNVLVTISDTTAPASPTGLVAVAGDAVVDLDWDDNSEIDFDYYDVYRSTTQGGPYSVINGVPLASSLYTDTDVINGTTYYYVVTASDSFGNESDLGNEASAIPVAPPPTIFHVATITPYVSPAGDQEYGEVAVLVLDETATPVEGALVTGIFTGEVTGSVAALTGPDGIALLISLKSNLGPVTYNFCVTEILRDSDIYDSGANVLTCADRVGVHTVTVDIASEIGPQ